MKKILVIVWVILISCTVSLGQNRFITGGVRVGANMAFSNQNFALQNGRSGILLGALMEVHPFSFLGISAEAVYTNESFKKVNKESATTYELGYIQTPIMANLYLTPYFALKAGLQPAFNISYTLNHDENDVNLESKYEKVNQKLLTMPVGFSFSLPEGKVVFDFRYNIGLTNVNYFDTEVTNKNFDFSSRVFTFSLLFRFF